MLIYLTGGGPLDGGFVEVTEDCSSYYDVLDDLTGCWHRYVEVVVPYMEPRVYEYIGIRADVDWWHR